VESVGDDLAQRKTTIIAKHCASRGGTKLSPPGQFCPGRGDNSVTPIILIQIPTSQKP